MHYLELEIHCAYSILLRICRVLEGVWLRLAEALRSWARILSEPQKIEHFFLLIFFSFFNVYKIPYTKYIQGVQLENVEKCSFSVFPDS